MAGTVSGDMDLLYAAQSVVHDKNSIADEMDKLSIEKKKLLKSIALEEKSITDEINNTIKKRRQQIADTYDERIDDNRDRKQKVSDKRDKKKTQRMNERFKKETKHIRENSEDLNIEMKTMLRKNGVPGFCGKKWYYIMFCPRGVDELLFALLGYAVCFAGVPFLVMQLIKKLFLNSKPDINMGAWKVGIFFLVLILMLVIYFAIFNSTRITHRDVIDAGRSIMDKLKANKRQSNAIRNSIEKDKDESQYDLGAFDEKLSRLDEEADDIGKEKQEALRTFEDETKNMITSEIQNRRMPKLEEMKAHRDEIDARLDDLDAQYQDVCGVIATQYNPVLGEDMCREDRIKDLIAIMEEGRAESIPEAIETYKGK